MADRALLAGNPQVAMEYAMFGMWNEILKKMIWKKNLTSYVLLIKAHAQFNYKITESKANSIWQSIPIRHLIASLQGLFGYSNFCTN